MFGEISKKKIHSRDVETIQNILVQVWYYTSEQSNIYNTWILYKIR